MRQLPQPTTAIFDLPVHNRSRVHTRLQSEAASQWRCCLDDVCRQREALKAVPDLAGPAKSALRGREYTIVLQAAAAFAC